MHKVIQTKDGSHSLYIEALDEHYHSVHGAIQESKHVFIEAGLYANTKGGMSILEIGLGTGLNALLTILANQKLKQNINYTAVEAFPVSAEIAGLLNYPDLLVDAVNTKENVQVLFQSIHSSEWDKKLTLSETFIFYKIKNTLQAIEFSDTFDLVYFDAFGPTAQPDMWTEEIFLKLWNAMNTEGILVTYCAKGIVKRTLKKIGFVVETLQGPPGKREMVRAVKHTK